MPSRHKQILGLVAGLPAWKSQARRKKEAYFFMGGGRRGWVWFKFWPWLFRVLPSLGNRSQWSLTQGTGETLFSRLKKPSEPWSLSSLANCSVLLLRLVKSVGVGDTRERWRHGREMIGMPCHIWWTHAACVSWGVLPRGESKLALGTNTQKPGRHSFESLCVEVQFASRLHQNHPRGHWKCIIPDYRIENLCGKTLDTVVLPRSPGDFDAAVWKLVKNPLLSAYLQY